MRLFHQLIGALCILLWGLQFIVADAAMAHISPILLVALRFIPVAIIAVLFVPRPAVKWRWILLYGTLMGSLEFGFLFAAMRTGLPTGLSSLIMQVSAPFTVILGVLLLRQRPSRQVLIGLVLCLIGLGGASVQRAETTSLLPVLLCILAGLAWAFGNITAAHIRSDRPFALAMWMSIAVPIPMLIAAVVVDGPAVTAAGLASFVGPEALTMWLALGFLSLLSSAIATGIWTMLMFTYPASQVAPLATLVPVVGMVTGHVVAGEELTAATIVAGCVMVAGLLLVTMRPRPFPWPSALPWPRAFGRLSRFGRLGRARRTRVSTAPIPVVADSL